MAADHQHNFTTGKDSDASVAQVLTGKLTFI
jgi:hypothetical protein